MLVTALAVTSCGLGEGETQSIDLTARPPVVMRTDPFRIAERYTFGHSVSEWVDQAGTMRITSVELIASVGVDVVDIAAYDPATVSSNVGLVPGWPPSGVPIVAQGAAVYEVVWPDLAVVVFGIEIREEHSGFRGIKVSWTDERGAAHSSVSDIAVVTCSTAGCSPDEMTSDQLLMQLRLWCPGDVCPPG